MINNDFDDEHEDVQWVEDICKTVVFTCGCCSECVCDENIICSNCLCACQTTASESSDDNDKHVDLSDYTINDFTIDIIENAHTERKVRINVNLDFLNNKNIVIKLDINKALYLQIAEDLFN
jgi:hypothetical protein